MHPNRIFQSFALLLALLAANQVAQAAATCPANIPLSTPTADFALNGDGTVTHLKTGLMWKQCAEGLSGASCATGAASLLTWSQSLNAAATPFAGYSDWRLPNKRELESIVETGCNGPSINETAFPATLFTFGNFWSSSTYALTPAQAWSVSFSGGFPLNTGAKTGGNYARLVRGGQSFDSFTAGAMANQTISFGAAPTVIVGGTGTVSATGGASGNAVTFTSTTTGVCTISGSTVTGVTAGTCTIVADQAGNGSYNAAPQVTQSFSVGLGNQVISFGAAPTVIVGGTGAVSATGGASGNAVTFTSSTTGICTISGSTVTGVTVGTCTIAADQAGNASYNAAAQATQSFNVGSAGLASQTISFGVAPAVVVGGTGAVSASGGASGNAVTFTSSTTGVCTISGSIVTGVTAGTCTIAANQAGNGSYNAAPQVTQSFSVGLNNQTLAFGAAPTVIVGGTGAVSATASSGLAVSFTSTTPGVCTVSGSTVTGVTTGTCTVAANQAGNGSYNAAPQVTQSFSVGLNNQTLAFGAVPTVIVGGTGAVSATATSGLTVSFTSSTPGVCTVSGSTVTGVTTGTCTVAANQAGNGSYNAAPQVTQSFNVGNASAIVQTISLGTPPTGVVVGGTGTLSASGGASGNTITFSSNTPSVCTVAGNTVIGVTAGTCTIAVNQGGNGSYSAAPQVTQSFSVAMAGQTISFGAAPVVTIGHAGTVSASGGASGNAVTFASTTTGICTISGSTVTGVTAGTCTIAANQAGNGSYNAAPQATQSFAVGLPGAVTAIPTLSEWGMIVLAGMLGLLGVGVMRQRSTTVRQAPTN